MTTLPPSRDVHPTSTHQINATPGGPGVVMKTGAGNEARTRDLDLGKVALYQLSYTRAFRPAFQPDIGATDFLERVTRLELVTSTLARLRSTN
jgi:hypothetical protein